MIVFEIRITYKRSLQEKDSFVNLILILYHVYERFLNNDTFFSTEVSGFYLFLDHRYHHSFITLPSVLKSFNPIYLGLP